MTHNRYERSSEDEPTEHGYGYTAEKIAKELAELGDDPEDN